MPRPATTRLLAWFRSNRGKVAWLAFFALACQLEFTFGHVHLRTGGAISAALASAADALRAAADDIRSMPAQAPPPGPARDVCAVCKSIGLASALLLPVSPTATLPIFLVHRLLRPLAAARLAARAVASFNARAPPSV